MTTSFNLQLKLLEKYIKCALSLTGECIQKTAYNDFVLYIAQRTIITRRKKRKQETQMKKKNVSCGSRVNFTIVARTRRVRILQS